MSKKLKLDIEEINGKFEGDFTEYYVSPLNDERSSTINYDKVYNKPKLNDVTLVGNISLDDIDVPSKEEARKVYSYDSIKKINEYLYELTYSKCDYEYARQYMETNFKDSDFSFGACSAVYKDGLFGKNFDWLYDNSISFIIKSNFGKYKSMGVSNSSIDGRLTKELVESGDYNDAYVMLPYYMDSGINDQGLMVGVNVVPTGDHGTTTGTLSSGKLTCSMMLPTLILDNCATAEEAINLIDSTNIFCPNNAKLTDEMHLFIGDKTNQYIIEFIENEVKLIDVTNNYPWMTNYYRYGAEFDTDGIVNWESLTPHSNGVHRSNIIANEYDSVDSVNEMKELMNQALKYTNTYQSPDDWIDEFCYNYAEYGDLTLEKVYTHPEEATPIIDYFLAAYEQRNRNNPITWQSVHSCVYDIINKTLNITTQEDESSSYTTTLEVTDYDAVWKSGSGEDSIETKNTQANGNFSVAEGLSTLANSDFSHAEGWASRTIVDTTDTETHGHASHAEGSHTIAKGAASHAEGNTTESIGWYSHAEGSGSVSGGISSHAEGDGTVTNNYAEHAEGSYNKSNVSSNSSLKDSTLHSIGIGTSMIDRKNALEIMQNGDTYLVGVGDYDGTNYLQTDTLQDTVNSKVSEDELNSKLSNYVTRTGSAQSILSQKTFMSDLTVDSGNLNLNGSSELVLGKGSNTPLSISATGLDLPLLKIDDSEYGYIVTTVELDNEALARNRAIAQAIAGVTQFDYLVVQSLPSTGVKGTIYLVPKIPDTQDIYDEYIWIESVWEHVGTTEIDLSNYYTKTEVNTALNTKQDSLDFKSLQSLDVKNTESLDIKNIESIELADVALSGSYIDLDDTPTIPTKTSDLTNDSNFQDDTQVAAALTSYYTKTEIDNMIGDVETLLEALL